MRTLNEELEAVKDDDTIIGAKPPKVRTLFDVVKTGNYSVEDFKKSKELVAPEYESDMSTRIRAGLSRGVQDIKNIPQNVEIFGGQVEMAIGGWAGSEEKVERGRSLIQTAKGELDAKEKAYYQSAIPMSSKDYESLSFGVGQGIVNYGSMLATGYLGGEIAGLASMAVLEGGQKAQEKIDYYTERTGDTELKGYTSQQAGKDALLTAIYETGSTILEKKLGYGQQRRLFKMPIGKKIRNVALTAVSEGGTETIQELYAVGIDLAGGYIDTSKLPERFIGAVKEGVIGGILGGTAGIAAAINHRSQAKQILREELKNTVPEKDLDNVVDAIYESTSDSMSNIITQELAQSEQLRNKHGAIYESLKSEVTKQIRDSGAYADVDEMKLSQYIEGTAKMFADQVLAEANKRGVLIDDVRKATDIVYRDGRLYLEGVSEKTKIKRAREKAKQTPSLLQFIRMRGGVIDEGGELKDMDASKSFVGLVNKNGTSLDSMGEALWEAGYFQNRPTTSEVLELIDDELRGNKHYPLGDIRTTDVSQVENEAMLDDALYDYADIMGYDLGKMSYDEKVQAYDQMQRNLNASDEVVYGEESPATIAEDIFDLSFFQVADENQRLDEMYPAYDGETITINGQEKTVYNSNGDRIAKSAEALQNFYKWFGDSKVVDEQGRPLVVYHGTNAEFSVFDKSKQKGSSYYGKGFYFTNWSDVSTYGKIKMPLYLNIKNPLIIKEGDVSSLKAAEDVIGVHPDMPDEQKEWDFEGWAKYTLGYRSDIEGNIESVLSSKGYDGVVILDTENDGQRNKYIAFEPNQIKSTSNRGTYSESENIYYQESDDRDLYATHNMSLAGVRDALKLGGLAMPSLAMRKVSQGNINQFGDIVFVANERLATPSRTNEVYDRDAWTPNLSYAIKYDLKPEANTFVKNVLERVGRGRETSTFVYNIVDSIGSPASNTMAMDLYEIDKGLEDSKFRGDEQGYRDWYDEHFTANTEPYLWTENASNTDMVRKKFTLDNMMKILRKQEKSGGGFIGDYIFDVYKLLNFRSQKFKNLKEIKKNRSKLVSREEQKEALDKLNEDFLALAEELKKEGEDYSFGDATYGLGLALIQDNDEKIVYWLKDKNLQSDDAAVKKVKDFIERMKNIPTDYFEVKPRRTVDFSEFSGVIIPEGAQYDEVARILEKQHYLNVERVEKGNEEQYEKALQNIQANASTTFFQVKNLPKQKGKIKGAFDALTKSIEITSEADFSTYQHEFGHYWIDNIWNYVKSGKASPAYVKQFKELTKWLGVKPNQEYLTRAQHEKFARAHEKWLYKGDIPNPIVGEFFKGYDSFIREVYSSIAEIDTRAGVKYKPLPKLVYDFFNSMVSGTLPYYGGVDEPKEVVEKETKEVKEFVKEEQKVLAENTQNYTLKPVQTDTETGYLTAYKKMTGEQVEAGVVNLEKEQAKAEKFVSENPELAKQIVDGVAPVPEGMLKNTIYLAYDKLQKRLGNTQNRVNSLMNQALELRRMGQEISSQRLAYGDETSPLYWIQTIQDNKASALADANKMKVKELNDLIKKSITNGMKQGKTAKEIAKELREQLGVTEFYQEEVYPTEETEQASYNYIYKYVNQQLGLGMTMEEAETITRKADDMLSALENSKAPNGNPSVDYFVKQKDLENYANSVAPSSQARVLVSVVGRGNLLFSIKSPLTNVVSNAFVGAYRAAVRRIMLKTNESIVSPELIKQNKQYSWEIFRKTGYNVNNITPETPRNTILGEKLTHSEGEGNIRRLGRFYENLIYKWSLGAGDVIFKDYAFTDYVALRATKESGGDVIKANEIFKDACLIEPQTELGQEIRNEAIQESLIATYQNQGLISEKALKARSAMDFGVGFGEFIAPFVKTPANVVSMGLKAGFGSVKAVASEIQRDLKAGKIQKPTRENIELVVQNGLGVLVAALLLGAIDDEDYMPPYALATNKDKQLAKELNIGYNAIRIGNTWVSLDYLGPLASPLVGLLQARREDGALNSMFGYTKSGMIQSLSIPAFGNISDIFTNIQNTVRKDGADVAKQTLDDTIQAVYARTVPSIVSDVAKMLDMYDRETKGHEIQAKIPFAREQLPKKVNVTSGRAESLDNPIQELLFGARAKTQVVNSVANELQRLNAIGYGVSLTPVTQRGLLSDLDENTKDKVRQDFAKEYSKQVGALIKSPKYKKMDDEDKQQSIDKIRRKTVESLKKRYLKK